jgi:hypothetical protein
MSDEYQLVFGHHFKHCSCVDEGDCPIGAGGLCHHNLHPKILCEEVEAAHYEWSDETP